MEAKKNGLLKASLLSLSISLVLPVHAANPPATLEEMWTIIQRQQQEIELLKQQLQTTDQKVEQTEQKVQETEEKIEATSIMLEETSTGAPWTEKSQFGAYGEMHYNNLRNDKAGGDDKKEIDFHRFVLFFGHQFNDKIRFFSELELEHSISGDGQKGEVELEQAYIDFDITKQLTARGGLFVLPIGIINETHEPPTFYGTERNPVEKNIIPSTWWEGGAALIGRPLPGLQYDLAFHSGLEVGASGDANAYNIRKGRQKVGKASAENWAATGRLKYTGIKGLELASTVQYQDDITQGKDPQAGNAVLWEAHAIYTRQSFMIKALYGMWNLDGDGPKAVGKDEQLGWYIEPSYKFNEQWGIFARYNFWDNGAGNDADTEYEQVDIGFNYWPHPNVVLKFDYQMQDTPDGNNEFDGFNVGLGYQFY
jgi:hypothetical protein